VAHWALCITKTTVRIQTVIITHSKVYTRCHSKLITTCNRSTVIRVQGLTGPWKWASKQTLSKLKELPHKFRNSSLVWTGSLLNLMLRCFNRSHSLKLLTIILHSYTISPWAIIFFLVCNRFKLLFPHLMVFNLHHWIKIILTQINSDNKGLERHKITVARLNKIM
jgi:hypothetical protein